MPQFSTITLGTTVFTPERMKGDVAFYTDVSQPILELRKTLSMSVTAPSKTSKLFKVRVKMVTPCEDPVLTGTVSHSVSADCVFMLPAKSSVAERTVLLTDLKALVAATGGELDDQVLDLAPIY